MDSGGRFTENTNDLSLAYARAQRDLTCTYTVGFYDPDAVEDKIRNVSVHVRRPGLHTVYPNKYLFRSEPVRRESLLQAAWFAPEQFATGVVQAHAFPVRPVSRNEWDAMLTVAFPIPIDALAQGDQTRTFGAVLSDGSRVVHRFDRRLTVRPANLAEHGSPRITIIERARLKPGAYTLTVVLSDPDEVQPDAAKVSVTLPEIPRRETFLVGPILARVAGPNLTVMTDGSGGDRAGGAGSFEPLLVLQYAGGQDVLALTQVCRVGKGSDPGGARIGRQLLDASGEAVGSLDPVRLELEGEGKIRCQNLLDVVPAGALEDDAYVFEALIADGEDATESARVRFAVDHDDD